MSNPAPHVDQGSASRRPRANDAAWRQFAQATTPESFCQAWLAIQCGSIPGVLAGAVFRVDPSTGSSALARVAGWGEATRNPERLAAAAGRAVSESRAVVVRDGGYLVGYLVRAHGAVVAAVAVDVGTRSEADVPTLLRRLEWGSGWLAMLAYRRTAARERRASRRLQEALDTVASALGHERFTGAATGFVTAVAARLGCDRVTLGLVRGARARVRAVSHTARIGTRTNLLRGIEAAMDEAIDQKRPVVYPAPPDDEPCVTRAHAQLSAPQGAAVLTVPFAAGPRVLGALTLERPIARAFDRGAVQFVQAVSGLAGPMLATLAREDRWLVTKALDVGFRQLTHVVGPRHLGVKLAATAVAAVAAFLVLAVGEYRVAARAVVEPDARRVAAAPFTGYLREAPARPGDVVRQGQLLAALDDRELRLERARWSSQHEQLVRQQRQALAVRNAAQLAITAAQIDQALAQLALLDEQLAKSRVVAGVDGVVVGGDLSQSLGAPVEKGQVLFHLAPLDRYRVVLEVDERDIADVAVGQRGQLLLAATPDTPVRFTVEKITPVSTARDGRNYFRVEARPDRAPDWVRPGLEGVGKVTIDSRRLVRVWLRSLIDGARLALWTWLP